MRWGYAEGMQDNPLKLRQIHHVEFWVGNAKQAAFFYRQAFGFSQFAYAGLETGQPRPDVLRAAPGQGAARVHHAARRPTTPRPTTSRVHGDGVRDIAFLVDDADRGVRGGRPPRREAGHRAARPHRPARRVRRAAIQHLRRHAALVHLAERLPRAVPPGLRRARRARPGRRHPAHGPRRRQRRARQDERLGRLVLATCSASSASSASTTRTSPPSTAR